MTAHQLTHASFFRLACVLTLALSLTHCAEVVESDPGAPGGSGGVGSAGGVGGAGPVGGAGGVGGAGPTDGDDVPAIAFTNELTTELTLALRQDGAWSFETIEALAQNARYVTLAFDSKGVPHVGYQDPSNDELKYSTKQGGTWVTQVVDRGGGTGAWASIAIDSQDNPHIAYVIEDAKELFYAVRVGTSWISEIVTPATDFWIGNVDLALDARDVAHVSFLDGGALWYAVQSGSVWDTQRVEELQGPSFESRTSIAVNPGGEAHLAVYDLGEGLHHFSNDRGPWIGEVVAPGTMATGQYPAMAFTSTEDLVIGYGDFGTRSARVARHDGGAWTLETADDDIEDWVVDLSMAVDADDSPYLTYFDNADKLLMLAFEDGDEWEVETVDGVTTGGSASIAVRPAGRR